MREEELLEEGRGEQWRKTERKKAMTMMMMVRKKEVITEGAGD